VARPPVICGMGRSGTTLIKALVMTGADVVIYPEPRHTCLGRALDLLEEVRELYGRRGPGWQAMGEGRVEQILAYILRQVLCGIAGNSDPVRCSSRLHWGVKQPNGERHFDRLEGVLGNMAPFYLYCCREPLGVYESYLVMEWGDLVPKAFLKKLKESLETVLRMLEVAPGRTVLLPVHLLSAEVGYRRQAVGQLFRTLGITPADRTEEFVESWPPANTRDQAPAPSRVFPEKVRELLDRLARMLISNRLVERCNELISRHNLTSLHAP